MERRRHRESRQTSMAILTALPALVVLERFPVPVAAIAEDGAILFVNGAFATMVGRTVDEVTALTFDALFHEPPPADGSVVSAMRANADVIVDLAHRDGSVVRAKMSSSALIRDDDPVALATFQDMTERLWIDEV